MWDSVSVCLSVPAGRLTSLAHVSVPTMATAVNAALGEVCTLVRLSSTLRMQSRLLSLPGLSRMYMQSQASCLVTADRPTAEQVLQVYEARRAGIVTCKIVLEHAPRYALAPRMYGCRRCLHAHKWPGLRAWRFVSTSVSDHSAAQQVQQCVFAAASRSGAHAGIHRCGA